MYSSSYDLDLTIRQDKIEEQREARRRLLQASMGKPGSTRFEDALLARGAVLREVENSVFSEAWTLVAAIFIIMGFVADRHPGLLTLGIILLLIAGVGTIWKNLSLWGVSYKRSFDRTRVFPGEPVTMTLTVGNEKLLPLTWLRFTDDLPVAPDNAPNLSQLAADISGRFLLRHTFSMSSYEQLNRQVILRFAQRGFYKLGPVSYESGDVFTLFTIERQHKYLDTLIVYPQIWPLEELGIPAKEPFGELKVRRSLFTDPIKTRGIRDYQPQDRFRDVHWKATARRGRLQTKVYDPSTGMTMIVFMNVATFPKHWMGFDPQLLERAVSVAASIANYGMEQQWGIGLYANGSVPNSDQAIRVSSSRSPEQLNRILEALAAVTEFATGSIEQMMIRESPGLPWAATLVLVTAVVTEEILVTLIRLKESGRRIVLISLADDPPPQGLGHILTYHIPSTPPAFKGPSQSQTATEAALSTIPTPLPVGLELDEIDGEKWD